MVRIIDVGIALFGAILLSACGGQEPGDSGVRVEPLVPGGSPFHGVHGLRFDDEDRLYAVSVIGQSVFRIDTATREIETVVGPPEGMGDDIAIANDGTLVWTAIEDGIVYARAPDGRIRRLMENMKGVNAVSFSPDGERLFVTLVFYGDALYELDLAGVRPPRLIREGMGGLNAFEVGADGMIYGPLVFGAAVVRIDPDSGAMTTVSNEFASAGALKLESASTALVLDDGSTLKRVDLQTGATSVVAELPQGADNLDIDSMGRVFVSLSEVNAIAEVNLANGEVSYLFEPAPLTSPTGLAVVSERGRDRLYLGDLFGGVKLIDGASGAIEHTPVDIFQPAHIAVTSEHLIVVSEVFGAIQMLNRETFEVLATWQGLERPGDAIEVAFGEIIVAESGSGRLLRLSRSAPEARAPIIDGLDHPLGLGDAGDGAVYVTESGGGRLLRVELASGAAETIAAGLAQPEGLAVEPSGDVVLVEVGAKRIVRVDPASGAIEPVASDLPIGHSNGPSLYRGVAASATALYFNSDVENAIYKISN